MVAPRGQSVKTKDVFGGFFLFGFFYLQDAWEHVGKVLQQGCVAFIGQNKGRRSSSRQGADLKDPFQDALSMNDIKK